ncbi:ABC transporter ATP-binding protein [Limibacter armeniacum]|uniref:ABC transporter ATP-binding protein n=1 Tax=Limibacter armeniacum TaxID=466084 RepID=UPI002FE50CD5
MISIQYILKQYKDNVVVNIPSLEIEKGQSFGLVGNNGAGKTTLFRMLLDLVKPSGGHIYSNGADVSQGETWKSYTGSYLDEGFLIGYLRPDEYFAFVGKLHGLNKAEISARLQQYEELFNGEILGHKKYIRDLSKGNQKKVGIVAAMLPNPEVLVLDEPFANLDPTTQIRLKKLLREFKEEHGTTLLISSHDLNHVTEVCERIVVMQKGELVKDIVTEEATLKELEEYFALS